MSILYEDLRTFMICSRLSLVRIRNFSGKFEKKKNPAFCVPLIFFLNHAVHEITWKYCRTEQATENMAHAHCMLET